MNAEKPRNTSNGSIHQLSFRWVVPKPPLCSGTSIEDILSPSNQSRRIVKDSEFKAALGQCRFGVISISEVRMKLLPCLFLVAACASAADIDGNWKVEYAGGVANPKIYGAEFEFKVAGNKLGGKAHIGKGWPGTAPITKGTVEDSHVSFFVVGEAPSSAGHPK